MRDYGRVSCQFWRNYDLRKMTEDARHLALYILTSPHSNILGCYCLPRPYICDDMQWTPARVAKALQELSLNAFVILDDMSDWILIPKFLKWNALFNTNQGKSAGIMFKSIPDLAIKQLLIEEIKLYAKNIPDEYLKPSERIGQSIPEGLPKPSNPERIGKEEERREGGMGETELPRKRAPKEPFTPPTIEQARKYIEEKGYNIDAELFVAHYAANGWMRGKTPIKDWKMAIVTWHKRNRDRLISSGLTPGWDD